MKTHCSSLVILKMQIKAQSIANMYLPNAQNMEDRQWQVLTKMWSKWIEGGPIALWSHLEEFSAAPQIYVLCKAIRFLGSYRTECMHRLFTRHRKSLYQHYSLESTSRSFPSRLHASALGYSYVWHPCSRRLSSPQWCPEIWMLLLLSGNIKAQESVCSTIPFTQRTKKGKTMGLDLAALEDERVTGGVNEAGCGTCSILFPGLGASYTCVLIYTPVKIHRVVHLCDMTLL